MKTKEEIVGKCPHYKCGGDVIKVTEDIMLVSDFYGGRLSEPVKTGEKITFFCDRCRSPFVDINFKTGK